MDEGQEPDGGETSFEGSEALLGQSMWEEPRIGSTVAPQVERTWRRGGVSRFGAGAYARAGLPLENPVVFVMGSDPKPSQFAVVTHRQSTIATADAHCPEATLFLELE